jgi:hypothetical protein
VQLEVCAFVRVIWLLSKKKVRALQTIGSYSIALLIVLLAIPRTKWYYCRRPFVNNEFYLFCYTSKSGIKFVFYGHLFRLYIKTLKLLNLIFGLLRLFWCLNKKFWNVFLFLHNFIAWTYYWAGNKFWLKKILTNKW